MNLFFDDKTAKELLKHSQITLPTTILKKNSPITPEHFQNIPITNPQLAILNHNKHF